MTKCKPKRRPLAYVAARELICTMTTLLDTLVQAKVVIMVKQGDTYYIARWGTNKRRLLALAKRLNGA